MSPRPELRELLARFTPSERRMGAFLVGWALLGLLAGALPWTAERYSEGSERVLIPLADPRAALHAKSAALAAHLELARTPPDVPLDPNDATREELDRLPGVGPKTARRWIEVRSLRGPFFAPEDLRRVKGLGPKRLKGIAPHLRFPPGRAGDSRGRSLGQIDINGATETELTDLPRVGPVLAGRIVAYRSIHGPFRSLADLDSVPGVGAALLKRLQGRVRFE